MKTPTHGESKADYFQNCLIGCLLCLLTACTPQAVESSTCQLDSSNEISAQGSAEEATLTTSLSAGLNADTTLLLQQYTNERESIELFAPASWSLFRTDSTGFVFATAPDSSRNTFDFYLERKTTDFPTAASVMEYYLNEVLPATYPEGKSQVFHSEAPNLLPVFTFVGTSGGAERYAILIGELDCHVLLLTLATSEPSTENRAAILDAVLSSLRVNGKGLALNGEATSQL